MHAVMIPPSVFRRTCTNCTACEPQSERPNPTHRNGVLTRSVLQVGMYSFGIWLSKVESEIITRGVDVEERGAINFDKFLESLGPESSMSKAIKGSLLGVE